MIRNPRSVGFISFQARFTRFSVARSPGVVEEGKPAPDFELESDSGETVKLSDLRGKPVVLYFYPKDDTPGCTRQACGIRDAWGEFQRAGAEVFGISADDQASHEKFKSKYELPFTLLADPEHELGEPYGVGAGGQELVRALDLRDRRRRQRRADHAAREPGQPRRRGAGRPRNRLTARNSPRVSRMRMRGLEPPRGCPHTALNRARLPIPPHPRGRTV